MVLFIYNGYTITEQVSVAVSFWNYIRQMSSSDPGWEKEFRIKLFHVFPQYLQQTTGHYHDHATAVSFQMPFN